MESPKYRGDRLLHISLMDGQARALLADTSETCETARRTHTLSRVATAALGRLLTVSAMMGSMIKANDGSVTLTVKGDGPIGALVSVAHPDCSVKGYADHPRIQLPLKPNGKLDVGGAVGAGKLTVVRDMGLREPYVGQVDLVNGEIAADFTYYFATSEQQPTLLSLGVLTGEDFVLSAGGLLVQPLPECEDFVLDILESRSKQYSNISRRIAETPLDELIDEYFEGLKPQVLAEQRPRFECDCSVEKIERALISMGETELRDMIDNDHGAQLECHFCNRRYRFTAQELEELLERAR